MMKQLSALLTAAALFCTLHAHATTNVTTPTATVDTLAIPSMFSFQIGTDVMSSYVSRGTFQAGPSFQPTLKTGYGDLYFTAWGSIDFTASQMQELNLTLGYQIGQIDLCITDYYIAPHASAPGRFFQFDHTSTHTFEASIAYTVSRRVPICIWWGTMFAGADVSNAGRRNYSSYAEISYPFQIKKQIDLKTGVGFFPWSTENCFNTKGFAVTNVYLHASRQWTLDCGLRLGVLARLICNPYREQVNFVGGISFHM